MKLEKVIGVGNTATVYDWGENKVLKLFYQGYPKDAVEKEFNNAMAIRDMNFAKPKAYEMISYEKRMGIIYDKIEGESLLDWVSKTGDIQKCVEYMVNLHKQILQNKITNVPNYKEFLKYHASMAILKKRQGILKIVDKLRKRKVLMKTIDKLPDGDTLCHGDFHPGNILISDGHAAIIDFMNVCRGNYLYDVARTVFLIEYTPVSKEAPNREKILLFKKTLSDIYLSKMNVKREMIGDYLSILAVARAGECPDEN